MSTMTCGTCGTTIEIVPGYTIEHTCERKQACAKCGSVDISTKWMDRRTEDNQYKWDADHRTISGRDTTCRADGKTEHLHHHCRGCGFEWGTATLDAVKS